MVTLLDVSYDAFAEAATLNKVYYYLKPWPDALDGYVMACGNSEIVYRAEITAEPELSDFVSTILPTAISVSQEDDAVALVSLRSSFVQSKYDIQDTIIYIGTAVRGLATSAIGWKITRVILVDGSPTTSQTTKENEAIWDNRAIEVYM